MTAGGGNALRKKRYAYWRSYEGILLAKTRLRTDVTTAFAPRKATVGGRKDGGPVKFPGLMSSL